jgi:hypothetical protein
MGTFLQSTPPELTTPELATDTALSAGQSDGPGAAPMFYALIEKAAIPIAVLISLTAFFRYAAYGTRHLWFDEVYTSTVALQPKWIDIWNAFRAAVDVQAPLFYFVTRISWMLLGRNELALRLPEIVGTILFSWCLFFYVGKRLGAVFGLSAMILPLVTDLELFSGDARPYGMLMGAIGLGMVAWRNAVENPTRRSARFLFAASLALIVGSHAYAIIVVGMFAIAELARYLQTRRADRRLWSCSLAAIPPLALYWFPFHAARAAQSTKQGVLGQSKWPSWDNIPGFYGYFLGDRPLLLFLLTALLVCLVVLRKGPKARVPGMPAHEITLAVAIAASPFFCVVLAMLVTKYYLYRYSVYAIGGIAVLVVLLMDAVATSRRPASVMMLGVSVLLFCVDPFFVPFARDAVKKKDIELDVPFASVPPNAPLVIASGMAMLPADLYSSDADLARTYYLTSHDDCVRYTGSTIFDFGPPFTDFYHFRAHLEPYGTFVREHKKFWVYGPYSYKDDWQVKKLQDDGARIVEKGRYSGIVADNFLLEVEMP